jgi:molybdopterin synthase catalytic subunit
MIAITSKDFSVDEVIRSMKTRENGAIVSFLGIVRGETEGVIVERLEVQAYEEMALRQLEDIRKEALKKFDVNQIAIIHRRGVLDVTENIVLIAVGGAHRDDAFKACRFVLEELKAKVPLWKKEVTSEGSFWLGEQTK